MGLALKAQDQWRNEPLYSPYYHESGIVKIETGENGKKMVENFKRLGIDSPARLVAVDTLKEEYPLFRNTNLSSAKDCYINTTSGKLFPQDADVHGVPQTQNFYSSSDSIATI